MKDRYLNSITISAILAVVSIIAMTIGGELYSPFKDALKNIFSHHWIGKSIISFVGFIIVGYALSRISFSSNKGLTTLLNILAWAAVLGTISLGVFFVYEFIGHA